MSANNRLLYFGLIFLATFLAYFHSLDHPFTYLDDQVQVVDNAKIKQLTVEHIKAIFSSTSVGMYQPLTSLIYALVYAVSGLNATGFHLASLGLHLINLALLIRLLRQFNLDDWTILILGAVFALHPMQVESVAWVSAFSNLVFTAFYFLSILAYLQHLNSKKNRLWLSLLFFLLSCFSKATAVSLPLVLILIDQWHFGKWRWKKQLNKLPFLVISVIFGVITIQSRESAGHLSDLSQTFEWHHRIFLISKSIFFYLAKFLAPVNLSAFYPYPELNEGYFDPFIYLTFLLIGFIIYLIYRYRNHQRIRLGSLFFLLTLAPTLHFIPVGNQLTADRYLYLPMLGLLLLLSKWIPQLSLGWKRISFILLVASLGIGSYLRVGVWQNDQKIWEDVLAQYPRVAQAHNNLGSYLLLKDQPKEAFAHFDKAIEFKPNYADAYNNRGNLLAQAGKSKAAMNDFNKAIALRPHADAFYNRANELSKLGQLRLAIEDYTESIKIKAGPDAYTNRAFAYLKLKQLENCRRDLQQALKIDRGYHPAYFLLAMEARQRNDFDATCQNLRLAAKYGNQKAKNALAELCQNNSP